MKLRDSILVASDAIRVNPFRSFLTALGIVIGVGAVITMVSIGEGAKSQVTSQIQGLGSNLIMINPNFSRDSTERGRLRFETFRMFNADLIPVIKSCPSIAGAAPEAGDNQNVTFRSQSMSTSISATNEDYPKIRNLTLQSGSFFTAEEVKSGRRVAVLGSEVAAELFPGQDPIGQRIKIGRRRVMFTIIGTLAAKGQSGIMSQDNVVYVPITTQRRLFGNERLRIIYANAVNEEAMDKAVEEVTQALLTVFDSPDSFTIRNQAEILNTMQQLTGTLTLLLAGIAGISLLVGGIGIMNIMLVSVTERIREIGIRKAIGAREGEIMLQFLLESAALSLVGGGIGILLGWLGSMILAGVMRFPAVISYTAVTLAFGLSLGIGLFFGVYPARRAALLDPIEALRHE